MINLLVDLNQKTIICKGLTRARCREHVRVILPFYHSWLEHVGEPAPQRQMKVSPACPGLVTRWCSSPALWILFVRAFFNYFFLVDSAVSWTGATPDSHFCVLTGHQRTGGSFVMLVDFGSSNCFVVTSGRKTKCAAVPAVCGEVAVMYVIYW